MRPFCLPYTWHGTVVTLETKQMPAQAARQTAAGGRRRRRDNKERARKAQASADACLSDLEQWQPHAARAPLSGPLASAAAGIRSSTLPHLAPPAPTPCWLEHPDASRVSVATRALQDLFSGIQECVSSLRVRAVPPAGASGSVEQGETHVLQQQWGEGQRQRGRGGSSRGERVAAAKAGSRRGACAVDGSPAWPVLHWQTATLDEHHRPPRRDQPGSHTRHTAQPPARQAGTHTKQSGTQYPRTKPAQGGGSPTIPPPRPASTHLVLLLLHLLLHLGRSGGSAAGSGAAAGGDRAATRGHGGELGGTGGNHLQAREGRRRLRSGGACCAADKPRLQATGLTNLLADLPG